MATDLPIAWEHTERDNEMDKIQSKTYLRDRNRNITKGDYKRDGNTADG